MKLLSQGSMNIIVMPGWDTVDLSIVRHVARKFGFSAAVAYDLHEIASSEVRKNTVGVLLNRDAFGPGYSWPDAIAKVRLALPQARVVICHGFAEPLNWPEISRAGAFHSLWLPLKEAEVEQSLGFIWEAENRPAGPVEARHEMAGGRPNRRIPADRAGDFRSPFVNYAAS